MYGKLFSQMYDGTLATKGPWQALVTFQQLIILADKNGVVDMTVDAIARRTTIPIQIIQEGVKALLEPDPDSRSPNEDGRRITPISDSRAWGWQIVNYDHYRKIRSEEERREYHRQYMRNRRAVNQNVKVLTDGDQCQPIAVSSKQYAESKETAAPNGSRFTLTQLPADWSEFCKTERPDLDPELVFTDFRDYWIAVAGQKGRKADWLATWRGWVRRQSKIALRPSSQAAGASWWQSDSLMEAKAQELGISSRGLTRDQLRGKINERMAT